eukprot:261401-Pyramimonas_sp.AAC.1
MVGRERRAGQRGERGGRIAGPAPSGASSRGAPADVPAMRGLQRRRGRGRPEVARPASSSIPRLRRRPPADWPRP